MLKRRLRVLLGLALLLVLAAPPALAGDLDAEDVLSFLHATVTNGEVSFVDGCPEDDSVPEVDREYARRVLFYLIQDDEFLASRRRFERIVERSSTVALPTEVATGHFRMILRVEGLAPIYRALLATEREAYASKKPPKKDGEGRCDGAPDPPGEVCSCEKPIYDPDGKFSGNCEKTPVSCNDCKKKKVAGPSATVDARRH